MASRPAPSAGDGFRCAELLHVLSGPRAGAQAPLLRVIRPQVRLDGRAILYRSTDVVQDRRAARSFPRECSIRSPPTSGGSTTLPSGCGCRSMCRETL